jgi:toxin-antitoxin system PIN domain toxin
LCDVNVLVALALPTHVHHRSAHTALSTLTGTWATCPTTESSFLRLLLNPRVVGVELSTAHAVGQVRGMRSDARWRWLEDDSSLVEPVIDTSVLVGHRQVTDLHLVNLAARAGRVLATLDAGISAALAPADRRHVLVLAQ